MRQIIKLRQAYTESDLSFRFVIYAGLRFSCKHFACPNKYNCILVFTVSGVFEYQHTFNPAPRGLVPMFRASSVNWDKTEGKRAVRSLLQAGICLALCLFCPDLLDLPSWLEHCLSSLLWLCTAALGLQLIPAVSLGLLCSPCWGAARLCPNKHWAHNKRVWHVTFPSTCLKNETSLVYYRKKSYHVFIKSLAGSCLIVKQ